MIYHFRFPPFYICILYKNTCHIDYVLHKTKQKSCFLRYIWRKVSWKRTGNYATIFTGWSCFYLSIPIVFVRHLLGHILEDTENIDSLPNRSNNFTMYDGILVSFSFNKITCIFDKYVHIRVCEIDSFFKILMFILSSCFLIIWAIQYNNQSESTNVVA